VHWVVDAKPSVIKANLNDSNKVMNGRKQFSLNEKFNILKQIDSGKKQVAMAKV
jgi:hypothetical protein